MTALDSKNAIAASTLLQTLTGSCDPHLLNKRQARALQRRKRQGLPEYPPEPSPPVWGQHAPLAIDLEADGSGGL
jgi:hypothetical protein